MDVSYVVKGYAQEGDEKKEAFYTGTSPARAFGYLRCHKEAEIEIEIWENGEIVFTHHQNDQKNSSCMCKEQGFNETIYTVLKNRYEPKLDVGSYFLAFNQDKENHYYVNFGSIEAIDDYISVNGLLNLYNKWLDYIVSDTIAETVESYYIGKVLKENESDYNVQFMEVIPQQRKSILSIVEEQLIKHSCYEFKKERLGKHV